jgi:hypothetical protein
VEPHRPRLFHYRDRDGREVDLVLERRDGSVIGVEVKTAASVSSGDFRGLRFEDRLAAVSLSGLWAGEASNYAPSSG